MDMTETAFGLILNAGNAKYNASKAVEAAEQYDFTQARSYLEQAREELKLSHEMQTELIQDEAKGRMHPFGLIMVHAQDHLTMAMMSIDHAKQMVSLYSRLQKLEQG